jgi:hypothetical protein
MTLLELLEKLTADAYLQGADTAMPRHKTIEFNDAFGLAAKGVNAQVDAAIHAALIELSESEAGQRFAITVAYLEASRSERIVHAQLREVIGHLLKENIDFNKLPPLYGDKYPNDKKLFEGLYRPGTGSGF